MEIRGFNGDYRFLCNHAKITIHYDGENYPSVENAYQSSKVNREDRMRFVLCSPYEAMLLGTRIHPSEQWQRNKDQIMFDLVNRKFTENKDLKLKLIATAPNTLLYVNSWNERYWGMSHHGVGDNRLGKMLASIRQRLVEEMPDSMLKLEIMPQVMNSNRNKDRSQKKKQKRFIPEYVPSEEFVIPSKIETEESNLEIEPNYILRIDYHGKSLRIYCLNKQHAEELQRAMKRSAVHIEIETYQPAALTEEDNPIENAIALP